MAVFQLGWLHAGNVRQCQPLCGPLCLSEGIAPKKMSFETIAGIISAEVNDEVVKVRLTDPSPVQSIGKLIFDDCQFALDSVDTGVPMP